MKVPRHGVALGFVEPSLLSRHGRGGPGTVGNSGANFIQSLNSDIIRDDIMTKAPLISDSPETGLSGTCTLMAPSLSTDLIAAIKVLVTSYTETISLFEEALEPSQSSLTLPGTSRSISSV